MIRVFTAFSGYDSQCLALNVLMKSENFPPGTQFRQDGATSLLPIPFIYELVGWSEIDKYAIKAHNALFPQWAERNYGDISKIDWAQVPDFDLFTYSSPCQDFSQAGKQEGGTEGSGTTAVACIKEKRHFIGFELNKEYYDKACKRIDAERRQLTLF